MDQLRKKSCIIAVGLVSLSCCLQMLAGDASLAWDSSTSEGVVGYRVHFGSASGSYNAFRTVTNQTAFTLAGPSVGTLPADINEYVEIVRDGVLLVGSTSYRGRNSQSFITTFPLVSSLENNVTFTHVASNDLFYTEMALANPGNTDASVSLYLFNGRGEQVDSLKIALPSGRRKGFSLKEVFKSLQYNTQIGGHFTVSSDVPIAAFSLFGKNDQSVFSAIPTQ